MSGNHYIKKKRYTVENGLIDTILYNGMSSFLSRLLQTDKCGSISLYIRVYAQMSNMLAANNSLKVFKWIFSIFQLHCFNQSDLKNGQKYSFTNLSNHRFIKLVMGGISYWILKQGFSRLFVERWRINQAQQNSEGGLRSDYLAIYGGQ